MTLPAAIASRGSIGPWRGLVSVALAIGCTVHIGCATQASLEPRPLPLLLPLPLGEYAALREQIRGEAKTYCGTCHRSSLATAKPAALAIYDLDRDNWVSTLTPQQLQNGFPRRLNARLDDGGRQQLRAFIAAELAQRGAP